MRERVIEHERPSRFVFEVISAAPVRSYVGTQTFEDDGKGGTVVTYAIELEPRVPGTGIAVAAGVRASVALLMRLAGPEARERGAAAGRAAGAAAQA